jgi:hypothetical protein
VKALILVTSDMEDIEFFYAYHCLWEEGWEIAVAASEGKKIVGKHGYDFEPKMRIPGQGGTFQQRRGDQGISGESLTLCQAVPAVACQ